MRHTELAENVKVIELRAAGAYGWKLQDLTILTKTRLLGSAYNASSDTAVKVIAKPRESLPHNRIFSGRFDTLEHIL